jgi:acyl-CoA thioester hydrolase
MYYFETKLRVRYGETDQMGFAYYGVYAQYYEVGRVELLRSLGVTYKEIEAMGYALPVVNLNINYKKPALYDDELTIKTIIKVMPSVKIVFEYETFNENGDLLNQGEVILVFINKDTGKPCSAPQVIINKLKEKLLQ